MASHVSESEIVLFVQGRLSSAERDRVAHHAADCEQCAGMIAAAVAGPTPAENLPELPASVFERAARLGSGGKRTWADLRWAAAAVIVLAGILVIRSGSDEEPDRFRSTDAPASTLVLLPPDASVQRAPAPVLSWSGVQAASGYRCRVFHSSGIEVLTYSGTDTAVILGTSVALKPGEEYFWNVEVLFPDSRIHQSELQTFRYEPNLPR